MAWFRRLLQHGLRPAVGALLLSLLGLQFAVAAYACPQWTAADGQPAIAQASAQPDCHGPATGMDPTLTPLCAAHCQPDPSTPTTPASLDQPLLQALALCLSHARPAPAPRLVRPLQTPGEAALAHAWSPPLFLCLQVFRN